MEMETWNSRMAVINDWLENSKNDSDEFEESGLIIKMMQRRAAKKGNDNPELLKKMWNVVRTELKQYEDSPVTRRSIYPEYVIESLGIILNQAYAAHHAFFEESEIIQLVHFRRNKGVVSTYETASDYAEHKTQTLKNQLLRLFKNEQWDGTVDGLTTIDHNDREE